MSISSNRPRFAILGVGAVGGLYGGRLAKANYECHFLARNDYEHIVQHGLQVDTPTGNFNIRPNVYIDVETMPPVDCVLVCWKTTANQSLNRALAHFEKIGKPTVPLLQNGLNIEETAAQLVEPERVLGGCCFLCANRIGPGHIKHLDYGGIAIGSFDKALEGKITERMTWIAHAMSQAQIEIQLSPSLAQIRWKKLTWNIPFNGLSVVLNVDTSQLLSDACGAELVKQLMLEVAASAKACGVQVEQAHIDKMISDTRSMVPYASSMLLDYQAGRPMEVEAIFGNPLRAALSAGYRPARIEMLYQQLSFLNRTLLG